MWGPCGRHDRHDGEEPGLRRRSAKPPRPLQDHTNCLFACGNGGGGGGGHGGKCGARKTLVRGLGGGGMTEAATRPSGPGAQVAGGGGSQKVLWDSTQFVVWGFTGAHGHIACADADARWSGGAADLRTHFRHVQRPEKEAAGRGVCGIARQHRDDGRGGGGVL